MFFFLIAFSILPIIWGDQALAAQLQDELQAELQSGDILLQELDCYACPYIEAQERTRFAHMGLYLKVEKKDMVLESWGQVRLTTLNDFKARSRSGAKLQVRRLRHIPFSSKQLVQAAAAYLGLSYDEEFLWDNFDDKGEKLYCSELITKVLQAAGVKRLPLKPMRFDVNPDFWRRYFNGRIPWYEPGNSPADFERSQLFMTVGEL